ncbi:MAG: tetratricopeptide repeat protein [Saprospiraceae bacterium]
MKNLISVSLIILSLHLFTSVPLHCQSSALVDSLHRQLRLHPQPDSVRWNLLYALARNYRQTNPDSGIFYSSAAYELAQQLKDDVFIFNSYNVLGVSYTIRNREDQGLAWFLKALELAKSHAGDAWRKMQAQALINIAGLFYAQQQFEKALPYAKAAESILILLNEPQVLADDYQSLGLMYSNLTKLDSALLYFSKALAIYENLGNRQQQGRVLREIGNIQYKQEHSRQPWTICKKP